MDEAVHQRHVGAQPQLQVQVGALAHGGALAGVRHDDTAVVLPLGGEHALPENRLHLGDVMAVDADQLGLVNIHVGGSGAVGAKVGHQPGGGSSGAEARVTVDIGGLQPTAPELAQRVELLDGELARVVAGQVFMALVPGRVEVMEEEVHGFVPAHGLEIGAFVPAQQRGCATMPIMIRAPAVFTLRPQVAEVHGVAGVAAHPDNVVVLDGNIHPTAIGAQDTSGMHPALRLAVNT